MDVTRYMSSSSRSLGAKRYVLLMQRTRQAAELELKMIAKAIEHALPTHTLIRLDEPTEGLKVLNVKNIEVLVLHHSLTTTDEELVLFAKQMKERKKLTVIFVIRNERDLIAAYRENMALYEELDDFVNSPPDPTELYKKLQKAGAVESRAAKRFTVDIPVKVMRVDSQEELTGELDDLSLVGCGLTFPSDLGFRRDEQLRIQIPLNAFGIFHPQYGDFLKLALRIRRLSIRGLSLGCSIHHLTSMQNDCLVNLLEDIARKQRNFKAIGKDKKGAQLEAK